MKGREARVKTYLQKNIQIKGMITYIVLLILAGLLSSCQKSNDSFSLLSEQSTFKQSTAIVPRKIDILWVIDNSGSMNSSQANIASNFRSFIQKFQQKNYDFQIGVTSSDAYLAYHYNDNNRSKLRDGAKISSSVTTSSGFRIIDKNTPSIESTFLTNITQGTLGNGDERVFMSMQHTLQNPLNAAFKRQGSYLAVIIVSDEEDFSHADYQNGISSYYFTENASDPKMYSVQSYVDFLNTFTNSTALIRNYSVSSIYTNNAACRTQLASTAKVSLRNPQLSDLTGGVKASLCGNFADSLQLISDTVLDLASVFQLDREPIPESIVVSVNNSIVPQHAINGWTYEAAANTVSFHGSAVPPADANISITFDPVTVKQ